MNVSNNLLNNIKNNFELSVDFTHSCKLPEVQRKCFRTTCHCLYCGRNEPHLNRYCLLSGRWNSHMLQQFGGVIARW